MIYDIKDDPILQVLSQEPSISSKYPARNHQHPWRLGIQAYNKIRLSMKSKKTSSSKSPVKNNKRPPSPPWRKNINFWIKLKQ